MQGQTAVHSAASQNSQKDMDHGNAARYHDLQSEENIPEWRLVTKTFADYAHVNLLYEQTVSTLVALDFCLNKMIRFGPQNSVTL